MAASFESAHVHAVYDEIASDFSRTRHSRWPFVERFLDSLPPGGLVLDAGTGNGKYLGCRSVLEWDGKHDQPTPKGGKGKAKAVQEPSPAPSAPPASRADLLPLGFDMSTGLLSIASGKGHEVVRGDCVDLSCWRRGAFNHAISIATIHHFATPERRVEAVKQMILAVLPTTPPSPPSPAPSTSSSASTPSPNIGDFSATDPPPSQLLIVVWSLEQDPSLAAHGGDRSARRTTSGKKGAVPIADAGAGESAREEGDAEGQDVFVPWERQEPHVPRADRDKPPRRRGRARAGEEAESAPAARAEDGGSSDAPDAPDAPPTAPATAEAPPKPVFNRYYHLFRQYELSSLVASASAQLGIAFEAPEGYALGPVAADASERAGEVVRPRDGWKAVVRLKEERWERENWVVEVEVAWRRVRSA
ncbi:uncharacterized protein JCM10292_004133 [Rhodotorula paludigena]|uniref:uncharacterized protein n=1 Tax=Rhodotorula paludigena TaxID=86838 RepID=UPI003171303B